MNGSHLNVLLYHKFSTLYSPQLRHLSDRGTSCIFSLSSVISHCVKTVIISRLSSNTWQPRFCFIAGNRRQSLGDKFASYIGRTYCILWNNFTILTFLYNIEFYLQNVLQFNDNVHVNICTSNFNHFQNFGMTNTICCEYSNKTPDDGQ